MPCSHYCDEFIPVAVKYSSALLCNLMRNKPATWDEVQEESQMFAQAFKVEPEACVAVEEATKQQAASALWFKFRAGRITASMAHAVCRTSLVRPSVSTVKRICYPEENSFFSPSTDWGRRNEDVASCTLRLSVKLLAHTFPRHTLTWQQAPTASFHALVVVMGCLKLSVPIQQAQCRMSSTKKMAV